MGKFVTVTSLDSGPFVPDYARKLLGWHLKGGIAYSPRIESLSALPPHELYDEWYIFGTLYDLGEIRRGNIFDVSSPAPGQVEVFVNFFGFALDAPEVQELVSRFWQQMEWIQPETYIAQSDYGFMTFVTRDTEVFETVESALKARKC